MALRAPSLAIGVANKQVAKFWQHQLNEDCILCKLQHRGLKLGKELPSMESLLMIGEELDRQVQL